MLNKTPKKLADVTVSEHELDPYKAKKSPVHLLIAVILIVLGGLLVLSGFRGIVAKGNSLGAPAGKVRIEVVVKPEERQRGLSGRTSMPKDSGMLFVFDEASKSHCLWMKDMKFVIDMIWLDEHKKVITIAENVSPDTFPQAFCPEEPARYALELSAGQAEVLGIKIGTNLIY